MKTIKVNTGWGTGVHAKFEQINLEQYKEKWQENTQIFRLVYLIDNPTTRKIADEKAKQVENLINEISELAFEECYKRETTQLVK
jgi:hypothetical protein